jgi:hypothetical protein
MPSTLAITWAPIRSEELVRMLRSGSGVARGSSAGDAFRAPDSVNGKVPISVG